MESREAALFVNFVNLVDLVRTSTCHQISLLEREISHKVHNVAGDGRPLSRSGQSQSAPGMPVKL
jgi:hypothetical protein